MWLFSCVVLILAVIQMPMPNTTMHFALFCHLLASLICTVMFTLKNEKLRLCCLLHNSLKIFLYLFMFNINISVDRYSKLQLRYDTVW